MGKFVDLAGEKFGRLTVIKIANTHITPSGQRKIQWLCKCECGNECIKSGSDLKTGNTKSCGCIRKNIMTKHGKSRTRIYKIWCGIIDRCLRTKNKRYCDYGGRGITVCDEWKKFMPFYSWSMNNGYRDDLTIDRIDNDKGYSPDNCRWATSYEQGNNRRSNRNISHNGKSQSLRKWADELNIEYSLLKGRLNNGWSFEKAISTPKMSRKK